MHTYEVQGTLFRFPEAKQVAPDLLRKNGHSWNEVHRLIEEEPERVERDYEAYLRREFLDKAAKVKPGRVNHKIGPDKIPQHRCPKPGTGEWSPASGKPGATVYVEYSGEVWEGQVQFPAPGGRMVWVSFWDGKEPVKIRLDEDDPSQGRPS